MSNSGDRLDTWKEIGKYLGKEERTARRWAAGRGLPVHRVPGGKRASVYALKSEIDAWLLHNEPNAGDQANSGATAPPSQAGSNRYLSGLWVGVSVLVLVTVIAGARSFELRETHPYLSIKKVTYLTNDGGRKISVRFGAQTVFFVEESVARTRLLSVPAGGGPVREIPTPVAMPELLDADHKTGRLLIDDRSAPPGRRPLWVLSDGQPPRPLDPIQAEAARWAPDGEHIAFSDGHNLYLAGRYGERAARLLRVTPLGIIGLSWPPKGDRLRFLELSYDLDEPSAWELILRDGARPQPLPLPPNCCQTWAWGPPGLFYTTRAGAVASGALRMIPDRPNAAPLAVSVPASVKSIAGFAVDWDHQSIFLLADTGVRVDILRVDRRSGAASPFLPGLSAKDLDFSPDGQWLAYVRMSDSTLWRSRADGSDALQLTKTPLAVELPRWSPDGSKLAFAGVRPGEPETIFVIPRDGGRPREAAPTGDHQGAPTWSSDGGSLAYGNLYCEESRSCAIHILRLADRRVQTVPGSQGLRTARWSPDGRWIAALTSDTREVRIFDVRSHLWRSLAQGVHGDSLAWSRDSTSIYAMDVSLPGPKILRIRVPDGGRTTWADLGALEIKRSDLLGWFGFTPDGSPILLYKHATSEILRADW